MDAPAFPPAPENKPVAPLLPPVLLRPSVLLWLWVLPLAVLLVLNVQGYWLIEGNMDAKQHMRAHLFGLAGLVNLMLGVGLYFAGRLQVKNRPESDGTLSVWWSVPAIVAQAGFLWMAVAWGDRDILPRSVTDWIYTPQRFFYNQFAFAMVPLFWGLIRLACVRPEKGRGKALVVSLVMAVAAPVMLYGALQFLFSAGRHFEFSPYVVAILIIVLGVLMFVAIIRGIALGLRGVDVWSGATERIAIVIFALALPLGGLILNREIPFPNDFQAWEVYALTVANTVFLLLASWLHARRPLLSLGLLCATLPFSLYFFTVFLPFLPLSIFAVILMGAGFLVLTPTVLLILHLSLLNKARRGSSGRRLVTGVLCFLLLPGFFTVRGLADKAALNAALDYVYAPAIKDGAMTYESSRMNLRRALANHRSYKDGIYYPLLSDYYAWLVFDDLVLPDDKLARLEETFFGKTDVAKNKSRNRGDIWGGGRGSSNRDRNRMPRANPPPRTIEVANMEITTKPAGDDVTTATVKLTLRNTGIINAEYIKKLPLPAGVYVSGFRLHIDGKPVPGRITEKKTALWVYTMIRDSERRDPGLLFYNAPDEVELRVFPVVSGTPSVVEIDFVMPGGTEGASAWGRAGDVKWIPELPKPCVVPSENGAVAAGGLEALALPAVKRDSYLHVIVDRSQENGFEGDLAAALSGLKAKFPEARFVRVTLANYETVTLPMEKATLAVLPLRGGFFADLAVTQVLRTHRDADLDAAKTDGAPPVRPVIVILGRKAAVSAPELNIAKAWADVVPSLEMYGADASGALTAWPVAGTVETPLLRLGQSVRPLVGGRAVRFKPVVSAEILLEYWASEAKAWKRVEPVVVQSGETPWTRAVALQLMQQDYERSPGGSWIDLKTLVAASRESGVMLASTSYIVVENSAQWRMIDVSERKKLDQSAALNFKEAPAPSWVWLGAGFGLWLGFRRWRALSRRNAVERVASR
ncbi:MAG: MSEP-CTERM sorting domain-containing protein [Rariglobus sp.]